MSKRRILRTASAKQLVGRKIVGFKPNAFDNGRGGKAYDPVITLDNGTTLHFLTQETDVGEYGVRIIYIERG